ncbi:hypothetical protein NQ317_000079 [Molorchus minor]|uniref:Ankyrin repeat protein n=1 Tax=Molorchus minor TaxID=1323400 RepID=A0ABQ9IV38_9CUCU|nr:hypothetical protein NQ317_000079 [Molorchus minor]
MIPLILSSSAGHTEVVKLLSKKTNIVNYESSAGYSSLQYSAFKGWIRICRLLLDNGVDINMTDNRESTPLTRAASKYPDMLKIDYKDAYGNTPLLLACEEDKKLLCYW